MEREREVIQALPQQAQHRMAELALMGWRFHLYANRVMPGCSGWAAISPDTVMADRYGSTLYSLIGYVDNYYREEHA